MSRRKSMPLWLSCVLIIVIVCAYFYWKTDGFKQPINQNGDKEDPSVFDQLPDGGNGRLNIYFLDVGQGDCIIIEFPDNKTMIIDSGNNWTSCEEKIDEFAQQLNITRFDYMLLTHADADHVGSFDHVFRQYEVGKVFRPNVLSTHSSASNLNEGVNVGFSNKEGGKESETKAYYDFLYCMQEEGCEWEVFNKDSDFSGSCTIDNQEYSYVFDFLTPVASKDQIKYKDANDYSPIVSLTYNDVVVLLTGDAETEMEQEFMNYYSGRYPDCDLLKVGHHGSATSTSQGFINAVKPQYAVIQCGVTEKYMHPRQSVLDRLNGAGCSRYRTDKNGDIAVSIGNDAEYSFTSGSIFCTNINIADNLIGGDTYFYQQQQ